MCAASGRHQCELRTHFISDSFYVANKMCGESQAPRGRCHTSQNRHSIWVQNPKPLMICEENGTRTINYSSCLRLPFYLQLPNLRVHHQSIIKCVCHPRVRVPCCIQPVREKLGGLRFRWKRVTFQQHFIGRPQGVSARHGHRGQTWTPTCSYSCFSQKDATGSTHRRPAEVMHLK